MASRPYVISSLTGGRNGVDFPASPEFPEDQCAEAINVDFRSGGIGRRRGGCVAVSGAGIFGAPIAAMFRHTPGEETSGEVWAIDEGSPPVIGRMAAGLWSSISGAPTFASTNDIANTVTVSFNGKLFLFYLDGSAKDRIKVYDPLLGTIRYVGLDPGTTAPTVANTGAGAYPAVLRHYRVRFLQVVGALVIRKSEATPSVSFTPSGAGTAARITRPTAPSEGETHWLVEYSPDAQNWYVASGLTAIGTTTYDDSVLVQNEPNNPLSELVGTFTLIPSCKVGCTDGNRLIFANFDKAGFGSRVGWTPVLGSLDLGDDERMFQTANFKPYLDLDTKSRGGIKAIESIDGIIYVFKARQIWRLIPTEDLSRPYVARKVSGTVGAVSQQSLAIGEDAAGRACLYFWSHKGPYRVGPSMGLEYLGRDIEDLTRADDLPLINTSAKVIAHSQFHSNVGQWVSWFSTEANNTPNQATTLDVRRAIRRDAYGVRGGWSRISGRVGTAVCSCLGPYQQAGVTMNLRPWIGVSGNGVMLITDVDGVTDDAGVNFQAYVLTRSVGPFGRMLRVDQPLLALAGSAGAVVWLTSFGGGEAGSDPSSVTTVNAGARVLHRFQDASLAGAGILQLQIGDANPVSQAWEMYILEVDVFDDGEFRGF